MTVEHSEDGQQRFIAEDPLDQRADVMLGLPEAREMQGLTDWDLKAEQVRILAFLAGGVARDLAKLQRLLTQAVKEDVAVNPDVIQILDADLTGPRSDSRAMLMEQKFYDMIGSVGSVSQEVRRLLAQNKNNTPLRDSNL